jgi:uncharacterized small protein (DUF1192 family)
MISNVDIRDALSSLLPGSKWAFYGAITYDNLTWLDQDFAKPSKATIDAEIARLQAEYDAKQYQRDRAKEYPSFADQFDTLYHGGYDAWKAQIDAIKLKYPKV